MKNSIKKYTALLMAAVLLSGLILNVAGTESSAADRIEELVSQMSTEQKITQMIMPAFRTYEDNNVTSLPEDIKDYLGRHAFGGVCLFAQNFNDTEQSVRLTDELQSAIAPSSPQLLISADQEGGRITRINTGTQMPGNMALAATGSSTNAEKSAEIIGRELKALGINTDFGPVIDVNNNPSNPVIGVRSFSDDPEMVGEFGASYIKGLNASGTTGTVKHFPGHGDTATDSHSALPRIDKTYEDLKQCELVPYRTCIEAGVDIIMTTHIQFPRIETGKYISPEGDDIYLPATLSKTIISGILRTDMGYDGVIVTDAMEMDAIDKFFGRYDAAKLSINAGVDMILMPVSVTKKSDLADFDEYIDTLTEMAENGEISKDNINKSVTRILRLKEKKGLLDAYSSEGLDTRIAEAKAFVGSRANHDVEWELAKKAITLLKNDDALPIDPSREKTVILNHDSDFNLSAEFALQQLRNSGDISGDTTVTCDTFSDKEVSEITNLISDAKNVIIDNGIAGIAKLNPEENPDIAKINEITEYVHNNGGKVTVISYNLPYDVGLYQKADAIMTAYSARGMTSLPGEFEDYIVQYGANIPAAIYLCMSKSEGPSGVLPVNIPKITESYSFSNEILYPRGFSLKYKPVPVEKTDISKSTVSGLKKSYVYTGKNIKPSLKVKCNGKTLSSGKNYKITFSNNKNVGKATVKITGIGDYKGTITKSFTILPQAVKSVSAKGGSKQLVIKWKARTQQTDGYEVRYSTNKKFPSSKTKKAVIKSSKTGSKTIKKLKAKTKYYIQVRAYRKASNKTYYSSWTKTLNAKTK